MYRLGERPYQKQRRYAFVILMFAGLIMAVVWAANKYLQPETFLSTSEGSTRRVEVVSPPTKKIDTPIFSVSLPRDWENAESQFIPKANYVWRGTKEGSSPRSLEVYVDGIPGGMPVNRLLPLRANGDRVMVSGGVSDNCTTFTDASKADKRTNTILAKWSEVNFYCDTGNYARNVIGTGTPRAINSITLQGQTAGMHRFFFVYTDHGAKPDTVVFTDILDSFRVH